MHASVLSFASLIIFQLQVAPPDSVQLQPLRPPSTIETQWGNRITVQDGGSSSDSASQETASSLAPERGAGALRPPSPLRVLPLKPPTRLGAPIDDATSAPSSEDSEAISDDAARLAPAMPGDEPPTEERPASADAPKRHEVILPAGNFELVSRVNYEADRPLATAPLLVRAALTSPEDEAWQLPGQPVALYTALERAPERTTRIGMVRAYWRMTADVAAYYWSVEEGAFIAGLQASGRGGEQVLLNAARIGAQARLQQAKVTATGSQHELADLARISTRDLPPLPRDEPLVGAYQTKFDRIFANQAPPAGIRRIALSIPLQLELLETQAAAVAADTDAIKELHQEHRQGQATLESVLSAHDRLHRHRVEFLQSVRTYNEMIAEYALAIAGSTNNQTIVTMLIRNPSTPRTSQAPRRDSSGRPSAGVYPQNPNPPTQYPQNSYPNNSSPPSQNPASRYPANGSRAPAATAAPSSGGPRTSSRGGTWMSPKTTVRDGAVRGSSAIEEPRGGFSNEDYQAAPFSQSPRAPASETFEGADSRPALGAPFRE